MEEQVSEFGECETSTVCAHTYIQVFQSTARETTAFIPPPGLRGGLRRGMSLLEVAAKEAFCCRWLLGVWKRGCFNTGSGALRGVCNLEKKEVDLSKPEKYLVWTSAVNLLG